MNILQVHDESWDSGLCHYALTVAMQLGRRGHKVSLWCAAGSHAAQSARELGLRVRELKTPWLELPRLREELQDGDFQVVNAHTGSAHALAAVLVAGTRAALVRTRADARPARGHWLARQLARRTRAFIAANAAIKGQLKTAFPDSRVDLVLQGIAAPAQAAPLPEAPIIGIMGRLDPVKGHDVFMDAASLVRREHPSARFLAAGAGAPERLSRLRWQLGYIGLAEALEFLGFVEDGEAFRRRCRVAVVASTGSEAVSRAALEWMASGRPLVATSVGGLPDIVSHGETGLLVPPDDPGALAEALGQLLSNPAVAEAMGRRARQRFEQLFSLERFAAETERVYAEVSSQ